MTIPRHAERLTIYLLQTSHHGRSADYVEIVARARKASLAGVTVVQGVEGFGASATLHRRHATSVVEAVPVKIVVVEERERIEAFLAQIADLVKDAVVVRQPVEVLSQKARGDRSGPR